MPKAKPYSGPVEESVARQLLNSTGHTVEINGHGLLLGDALLAAAKQLRELVSEANVQLEGNEFAKIVADHLAQDLNRRGGADIAVTDNGTVQLYINYDGNPRQPNKQPKNKRKLPLMKELKARAKELGVEIPEELGIKRSKIVEYLDGIENKTPLKKKAVATVHKPEPTAVPKNPELPKVVKVAEDPDDGDPGPMSAGPDETKLSEPLEEAKLPKKRGFVKTSEAILGPVVVGEAPPNGEGKTKKIPPEGIPRGKRPSMSQLVEESKDVSIADLLASEPPK